MTNHELIKILYKIPNQMAEADYVKIHRCSKCRKGKISKCLCMLLHKLRGYCLIEKVEKG